MNEWKTDPWFRLGKPYWLTAGSSVICSFFVGTVAEETEHTLRLIGAVWVSDAGGIGSAISDNEIESAHATGIEITLVKAHVLNFLEWPHETMPTVGRK